MASTEQKLTRCLADSRALAQGAKNVSPIILINGVGAESYIEQLSSLQELEDPDARYNSMLANVPINGQGVSQPGAFTEPSIYPGVSSFNLTYANGTEEQIPLLAAIPASVGFNFTTGEQLFEATCLPHPNSGSDSSSTSSAALMAPSPAPQNYPNPIVKDPFNFAVGYFPTDAGLEDVAVLSVPTFETAGTGIPDNESAIFADEAQQFVNQAVAAGKKKFIIDVTGNGGGFFDSGFALLSIFFPNETIYSATRFRVSDSVEFVVRAFSADPNATTDGNAQTEFFLPTQVEPDQKTPFASIDQFLGPYDVLGVPSSALNAEDNFALEADPTNDPINTDGLGGQLNGTTPPFAPEDILIVSNLYNHPHILFLGTNSILDHRRQLWFNMHYLC